MKIAMIQNRLFEINKKYGAEYIQDCKEYLNNLFSLSRALNLRLPPRQYADQGMAHLTRFIFVGGLVMIS